MGAEKGGLACACGGRGWFDIDRVINALEYVESDKDVEYRPAALIKICIDQLKANLSVMNHELGCDWPENK